MKLAYLLILILVVSCGKQDGGNSNIISAAIINGTDLVKSDGVSKSLVALASGNEADCSATLISKDLVLTAAHCVSEWTHKKDPSKNKRINTLKSNSQLWFNTGRDSVGEYRKILKATIVNIRNEDDIMEHDVAVLKFAGAPPAGFAPVKLLDSSFELKLGTKLIVAGYGDTSTDQGISFLPAEPKKTTLRYVEDCGNVYVLRQKFEKLGIFYGDSGGPAYLKTKTGLVLAGSITGIDHKTDGYVVKVGRFKDFILNSAKKMKADLPVFTKEIL